MAFPLQAQACLKVSSKESALGQAGHLMVTGKREQDRRAQEKTLHAQDQLNSKPFPVGITPAYLLLLF